MEEIRELCHRAYAHQSYWPERLAESTYASLVANLADDLKELDDKAGDYASKYWELVRTWLHRKSRVMNWFITGPANFPVERNRKRMDSEQRAYEEFQAFRKRYIQRANRVPTPSPEEDLDNAMVELNKATQLHEDLKQINKIIRDKNPEKLDRLTQLTGSSAAAKKLLTYEPGYGMGIPQFELTSNRAKIKRLQDKIIIMKRRIEAKATFEPISFDGGSITIENDRVIIQHDDRPPADVIDRLKARGFRWSGRYKSWSRKHTSQAIIDAKKIIGIQ